MIPNVNQFTEQLRMMPDQALQRVAQMYKQDPYILPMVIAEDAARKKMRMAAQARAAQPQTKVVDQAIASLGYTPEEVGIGALQAQNMQGLADGGIAGYADGGDMDFADRSEPVVRMAEGGAVQRFQSGGQPAGISEKGRAVGVTPYGGIYGGERLLPTTTGYEGMELTEFLKLVYDNIAAGIPRNLAESKARQLMEERQAERMRTFRPRRSGKPEDFEREEKYIKDRQAGVEKAAETERLLAAYGPEAERMPQVQASQIPASGATSGAAAQRPTASGAATGAATSAPGTAPTAREFVSALTPQGAMDVAGTFLPTGAYEEALRKQRIREDARRLTAQARREEATPTEPAQAGLEALLKKQAEGAEKEMSQAGAWGLISAGLAVASGESPNALVNIAKGFNIGAKEYQAAVSKLKEAGKQRDLQLANIQEARRLEAKGDTKEALDRMERADEQQTASERYFLSAEQDLGLKRGQLAAGFFAKERETEAADRRQRLDFAHREYMQKIDIGSREALAKADAGLRRELAELPGPEQRLYAALGGGSVKDGFVFVQQAKTSEQAMATLAGKILSTPGAMEMLKKSNPDVYDSINAYIQGMGIRSVSAPPAGASVLP
jgi:hypothetical protein